MKRDDWDRLKSGDKIVGKCGRVRTVIHGPGDPGSRRGIVVCKKLVCNWAWGSPNAYLYPEVAAVYEIVEPDMSFLGEGI